MRIKRLTLAILAASALTACGDRSPSKGSTLPGSGVTLKPAAEQWLACVDFNRNWVCDDGDQNAWVAGAGETGLELSQGFYTLLEQRNNQNQRTRVLLSTHAKIDAASTLGVVAQLHAKSLEPLAITDLTADDLAALQDQYGEAISASQLPLAALTQVSLAAIEQVTSAPKMTAQKVNLGKGEPLAEWYSSDPSDTRRTLTAQGEWVLNNTDNNRLYLFDGAQEAIKSNEIDLIPLDETTLAQTNSLQRKVLAWARSALNVLVDSVSAATAINGEVSSGSPVVLAPGQGITSAQIVNGGREALIIMNMLEGDYTDSTCLDSPAVSEGIFRIPLQQGSSFQLLENAPSCIHSGFSLLAANSGGDRYGAWDSQAKRLWLFAENALHAQLDLKMSKPVQALSMTPGGRYLAAVAFGELAMVDVESGKVLHKLTGAWGNVIGSAFINGGRSLVIASDGDVHTVHLNHQLQPSARASKTLANQGEDLKALTAVPDGDSYFALSNREIRWLSSSGKSLASRALPPGLVVQQGAIAGNQLLVLARGSQDLKFVLLRYPLSIPLYAAAH